MTCTTGERRKQYYNQFRKCIFCGKLISHQPSETPICTNEQCRLIYVGSILAWPKK